MISNSTKLVLHSLNNAKEVTMKSITMHSVMKRIIKLLVVTSCVIKYPTIYREYKTMVNVAISKART